MDARRWKQSCITVRPLKMTFPPSNAMLAHIMSGRLAHYQKKKKKISSGSSKDTDTVFLLTSMAKI